MVIIEDTRNQIGKHKNINDQLAELGYKVVRNALSVGDYTYAVYQGVCIDTKSGLPEVAGNMVQDHARFRKECMRAQELGIHLVVLIEEGGIQSIDDVEKWQNPRLARWRKSSGKKPPINGDRLAKSMRTMAEKYGVRWDFCDRSGTGAKIIEILEGGIR